MKKIITLLTMMTILTLQIFPQDAPLGVKWGMTKKSFIKTMTNSTKFSMITDENEVIAFYAEEGVPSASIAGVYFNAVAGVFYSNQLCKVTYYTDYQTFKNCVIDIKTLDPIMEKKYTNYSDICVFKGDFEYGDGYELQAIAKGIGFYAKAYSNSVSKIELSIDLITTEWDYGKVRMMYFNEKLFDKAVYARQKRLESEL